MISHTSLQVEIDLTTQIEKLEDRIFNLRDQLMEYRAQIRVAAQEQLPELFKRRDFLEHELAEARQQCRWFNIERLRLKVERTPVKWLKI